MAIGSEFVPSSETLVDLASPLHNSQAWLHFQLVIVYVFSQVQLMPAWVCQHFGVGVVWGGHLCSYLTVVLETYLLLTSLFCSSTAPWTLEDGGSSCTSALHPTGFTGKPFPTCVTLSVKNYQTAEHFGQHWTPLALEIKYVLALWYSKRSSWISSNSITGELVRSAESQAPLRFVERN